MNVTSMRRCVSIFVFVVFVCCGQKISAATLPGGSVPSFINIGTVLSGEKFITLEEKEIFLKYRDKPTILLFWANFSTGKTLNKMMPVLQEAYEKNRDKANFYTVNFSENRKITKEILNQQHNTVPALIDIDPVVWERYTIVSPAFVAIDQNGVLRYRPMEDINAEDLGKFIESCRTPYVPLPEPQSAVEWVRRGEELHRNKNYIEAVDAYSHAIKMDPNFYVAYAMRVNTYKKLYQYGLIIPDVNKMIELAPEKIIPYYMRATNYRYLNQLDLAIADYNKIIELNPAEEDVYSERGSTYLQQGKYDAAIMDYTHALELNPQNAELYANRGSAYNKQYKYNLAIFDFTTAILVKPQDTYYDKRAFCYFQQKKYNLAIEDLTKLIDLNPEYRDAYSNRGRLFALKQQYIQAETDFRQANKRHPNNGYILFVLAQALELAQQQDEALRYYKEALKLLPTHEVKYLAKVQQRINGDWKTSPGWIE